MKIDSLKLVYFSPTGTTKKIIERIAGEIDHSTLEILDITRPEARKQNLQASENDFLIIGVPVYFGRVPSIAVEWLCNIKAHNTPAAGIVVYGNREYDDALLELKDVMVKSGCAPVACAAYIGEHSFSNSETPIAPARPDADDLNRAGLFGQKINKKLLSISSINQISGITIPGSYPYVDNAESKKRLSSVDFIAVDDNCSQCGACAQECPVGAIDSKNNFSADTERCILCCACIKKCPECARKVKAGIVEKIAKHMSQTCQIRKEPAFFF